MLNVFVGIAGSMPSAVHEDLSYLEDVLLGNLTNLPLCHRPDTECRFMTQGVFENPLVSSSADFFSV
jgi:hypothetical protein